MLEDHAAPIRATGVANHAPQDLVVALLVVLRADDRVVEASIDSLRYYMPSGESNRRVHDIIRRGGAQFAEPQNNAGRCLTRMPG